MQAEPLHHPLTAFRTTFICQIVICPGQHMQKQVKTLCVVSDADAGVVPLIIKNKLVKGESLQRGPCHSRRMAGARASIGDLTACTLAAL